MSVVTTFYFAVKSLEEEFEVDVGLDLPYLLSAIGYARRALSDMALDGIPAAHGARQPILGPDRVLS
jgi:hypothetical protein